MSDKNKSEEIDKTKPDLNEESLEIYPERRGKKYPENWFQSLVSREDINKIKCEQKVFDVIEKSPLVKLMMGALKSKGCEVDIRRHISCECCSLEVTGGYDPQLNQVVICHNRVWNKGLIRGVLAHEFIHMFDYCRAEMDFNNLEHIACSEIRAANLLHCSITTSLLQGTTGPLSFKKSHGVCVKAKAVASILAVRKDLPREEAWNIVDKVFDKCYNDLEPIGRRIRRGSNHMDWAHRERFHYHYY